MSLQTTTATNVFGAAPGLDEPHPTLIVVHHPDEALVGLRRTVPPGGRLRLGREGASLPGVFAVSGVSRRHAEIARQGERLTLTDLGSRNGTWLNGQRVAQAEVRPGDVVAVGAVLLLATHGPLAFRPPRHPRLLGHSPALAQVIEQITLVAARDTTTLILGETGSGKELVAEAIHTQSGASGRFVPVNCGAVSEQLLLSELFGHQKGAFSGAVAARTGLVETARDGTLFLDEVGDASPGFQQALLRLLEQGEYRPVGANVTKKARCRFVAATQPRVEEGVSEEGGLRADLWARLSRWVIRVPPLRERREDIPLLARRFAHGYAGREVALTPRLVLALLRYDWPGNVRELQAIVERAAVAAGEDPELDLTPWLSEALLADGGDAPPPVAAEPERKPRKRRPKKRRPERDALIALLERREGNLRQVADELDVDRRTLYRWLDAHDIDPNAFR